MRAVFRTLDSSKSSLHNFLKILVKIRVFSYPPLAENERYFSVIHKQQTICKSQLGILRSKTGNFLTYNSSL